MVRKGVDPNKDLTDEFSDIHSTFSVKTLKWTGKFYKERYLSNLSDMPSYLREEIEAWKPQTSWLCPRDCMTDACMASFLQWAFSDAVKRKKNAHTEARRVRFYLQACLKEYEMRAFGKST